MVSFTALLDEAADRLDGLLLFALVPLVVSLANPTNFGKIARSTADFRLGVSFGFPTTIATSWNFLSLPADGISPTVPPDALLSFVPVAGVGTLLTATLGTVYLGSLDSELRGRAPEPIADLRTHLPALLGFELLRLVGVLAVALAAAASLGLAVGLLLGGLVLIYLFYPVPYLVVATGAGLGRALRRSYRLTSRGGEYGSFFVRYLLAVGGVSLAATPLFTASTLGAVLGAVVLAPVCVLFNGATMAFVRQAEGLDTPDPSTGLTGVSGGPAFPWPEER
jgi:hypothetical protein